MLEKHPVPLTGVKRAEPSYAEQSSAAAQTDRPGQKADAKPKKASKEAADQKTRNRIINDPKQIYQDCKRVGGKRTVDTVHAPKERSYAQTNRDTH